MFVHQIGVVSEVDGITCRDVSLVAAALQKQVMRDFAPIWSLPALVSGFGELEDIPIGYWPVIIREDIGFAGAAGIHLDVDGQPFALVQASNSWALTASHEVLEMLADPFGNRLIAGNSIKPGQGRVEYLVEVCDPSEAAEFGYTSNGILVSDFYTPNYFDPIGAPGVRYSFTGAITKPRQVLRGGYLSWHNPVDNHWWQSKWFSGPKPKFVDLGVFDSGVESLRTEIDRRTFRKETASGLPARHKTLVAARAAEKMVACSTTIKAESWRSQIAAIRKRFK
ncbi:MAG: hypothetical protein IID37_02220 [Planctomycetes bacterium]|nr:hypothetical protein [Planctomycetota bacterium]